MLANRDLTLLSDNCNILPVLISPVSKAESGAFPHLKTVAFWNLSEFRTWSRQALSKIRELRRTLNEEGNLVWRAEAVRILEENELDMPNLFLNCSKRKAATALKK